MEPYRNLSGDSGVRYYETGPDFIRVQFQDRNTYVYDYARPGRQHVERMKSLASAGRGLATYINQHVRDDYASKED